MSKIRFENGQTVNFQGIPSQKDVDEVATKLGIQKTQPQPQKQGGFMGALQRQFSSENKTVGQNMALGAFKGLASTANSMSQVGQKVFGGAANKIVGAFAGKPVEPVKNAALPSFVTDAEGTAQKFGKGVEQVGEFFVPAGLTAKMSRILEGGIKATDLATKFGKSGKVLANVLSTATRSGLLAGEAAGVTSVQQYGKEDATDQVKMNAILSGAIPIAGAVYKGAVRPLIGKAGQKIQQSIIKPSIRDVKDGFKAENLAKYNIGGGLENMSQQVHNQIETLGNQLNEVIGSSPVTININSVLDDVERSLGTNATKTFGMNSKFGKAVESLREEAKMISQDGVVSLKEAQEIKRSVGKIGAWQYGMRDPESSALEKVANELYDKLKTSIEAASPEQIRGINSQLSELIPIENAIIRRIPVEARQNALSLSDAVTAIPGLMHPGNWWLFALNRLSKSGTVGGAMSKASKEVKDGGALKQLIYGGQKLSEAEKEVAGKVTGAIESMKGKGGLSIQAVGSKADPKAQGTKRGFGTGAGRPKSITKAQDNKITKNSLQEVLQDGAKEYIKKLENAKVIDLDAIQKYQDLIKRAPKITDIASLTRNIAELERKSKLKLMDEATKIRDEVFDGIRKRNLKIVAPNLIKQV